MNSGFCEETLECEMVCLCVCLCVKEKKAGDIERGREKKELGGRERAWESIFWVSFTLLSPAKFYFL